MPTFAIKRNDRLPLLRVNLTRSDGSIPDLTGATVRFKMGSPVPINGIADIVNAVGGVVEYPWAGADTASAGNFRGEFEVTYGSGKLETFPNDGYLVIQILEDLG